MELHSADLNRPAGRHSAHWSTPCLGRVYSWSASCLGRVHSWSTILGEYAVPPTPGPFLNGIKWDVNIFDDTVFQPYPRTQAEAESQGFTQIGSGTCEEGFAGHRYALNGDYSVIVVYDVNGYIAGIQNAISQADAEANSGGFPFEAQPAFRPDNIDGVDYWVLTAYFVDPAQVCVGRTSEEFDEFGTGTGLFIVTGPGAMDYDAIPSKQEDAELSEWVYGRCFVSMGEWTIVGTQQWLFGAPRCPKAVIAPDTFKYARERRLPKTPASSAQVCVGRTSEEFDEFGTGTGLFIVTGPGAMDYDAIPSKQEDAELSEWVYGRCFVSMGEWTIVGTQQWLFGAPRCPKAVIAPDTFKYARERRLPKTPASSGLD
ncbi:unnamed protein product [Notodromas monacha]|uniref:Uncharacterized protein n=1 Tax=Notodromas monacha TaxID=399045 RepID=A0A7R9BP81_9CRUS|nr:unnamed protein product [Notodromas monacha]CAG0918062.1 unnamed protein product [Notodromas monacha]